MKKIILTLAAIVATAFASFSQISLIDAYSTLSDLPGMTETSTASVSIDGKSTLNDVQSATVNSKNINSTRNQFYYIIESLPAREVVVSGNNKHEIATIFAEPAGLDLFNILILKGNSVTGDYTAVYGNTNITGLDALGDISLILDSDALARFTSPSESDILFTMNK